MKKKTKEPLTLSHEPPLPEHAYCEFKPPSHSYEERMATAEREWIIVARKVVKGDYDVKTRRNRFPPQGSLLSALVIGLRGLAFKGQPDALSALNHLGVSLEAARRE